MRLGPLPDSQGQRPVSFQFPSGMACTLRFSRSSTVIALALDGYVLQSSWVDRPDHVVSMDFCETSDFIPSYVQYNHHLCTHIATLLMQHICILHYIEQGASYPAHSNHPPPRPQNRPLRNRRPRPIIEPIDLIPQHTQRRKPSTHNLLRQHHSRRITPIRRDFIHKRSVIRRADRDCVLIYHIPFPTPSRTVTRGSRGGIQERDTEVDRRVLRPVEEETCDELVGLRGEIDGQGLRRVCAVRHPFRARCAVDGTEWELSWLIRVWGGDGEALRDITGIGCNIVDIPILQNQAAIAREMVRRAIAIPNLHGDRGISVCHIRRFKRCIQPLQRGGCLVRDRGDGPALPVEGAVAEMRDLRRQAGVYVQDVFGRQAQAEVAEERDLVVAAVAGEEGEGRVGASVGGEVVEELLAELEPGAARVRVFGVLLVGVGGTTGGGDGGGDDGEDCVGHAGAVEGLDCLV